MIPKIIHQIWFQGWNELPDKYKPNVQSVKDQNPNWSFMYWDDNGIQSALLLLGQNYLDKYNSFNLIHQKVDYGRYAVLYLYGGVSVDTDCFAIKSFDEAPYINERDFIVSDSVHTSKINNATILASKGNYILKYVLDQIDNSCNTNDNDFTCIQKTTGPTNFNVLLSKFANEITVLNYNYFEPCAGVDHHCEINKNAILDHRHELSWLSKKDKRVAKMYYDVKHFFGIKNRIPWQKPAKLNVGDIIETDSNILFVNHYGIMVNDGNELKVLHIYNSKPIIETQEKVFNSHTLLRVLPTGLNNYDILNKYDELKQKQYSFITFNCEDFVKDICGCDIGKDQRHLFIGITTIFAIVIIVIVIALSRNK